MMAMRMNIIRISLSSYGVVMVVSRENLSQNPGFTRWALTKQ
jgi:hypothetical protein